MPLCALVPGAGLGLHTAYAARTESQTNVQAVQQSPGTLQAFAEAAPQSAQAQPQPHPQPVSEEEKIRLKTQVTFDSCWRRLHDKYKDVRRLACTSRPALKDRIMKMLLGTVSLIGDQNSVAQEPTHWPSPSCGNCMAGACQTLLQLTAPAHPACMSGMPCMAPARAQPPPSQAFRSQGQPPGSPVPRAATLCRPGRRPKRSCG